MSSAWARSFTAFSAVFAALAASAPAHAQPLANADTAEPTDAEREARAKRGLPFHDSLFIWDHSATTETLGVGRETQSRNPTYEMTFRLAPRYYFVDEDTRSLSARGDVRLVREFTDSDTTTERGEWTFADAELWLQWVERLRDVPGQRTDFVLRAPSLVLPTSRVSASSGKVLGLGFAVGVDQGVSLRGADASFLKSTTLRPRAGYSYQFANATVPTSDGVTRVRLDPSGRSLPSDQLGGGAFPQHQLTLSLVTETILTDDLTLASELGLLYDYKYALAERVEVCGVLDTGCIDVETSRGATRSSVATGFVVELSYAFSELVSGAVGYANLSSQLGNDGQRRNVFYSPDARASLSLTFALDALYRNVR